MSKAEIPCTEMERYLFDLNGYLILKGALTPGQLAACNATYDEIEGFEGIGWHGNVHVTNTGGRKG
jgi:hypothetical protein